MRFTEADEKPCVPYIIASDARKGKAEYCLKNIEKRRMTKELLLQDPVDESIRSSGTTARRPTEELSIRKEN